MPETNILETLINTNSGTNHSLEKLATYLSSNKTYKYTPTYLFDSDTEFKSFTKNLVQLKTEMINIFSEYSQAIQKLPLPLLRFSYEIQINNAISVNDESPENIKIINKNEDKLLSFVNQSDSFYHHLTLKFNYDIQDTLTHWQEKRPFTFNLEHTFKIENKKEIKSSIESFINLLNLDLCARASYISK